LLFSASSAALSLRSLRLKALLALPRILAHFDDARTSHSPS